MEIKLQLEKHNIMNLEIEKALIDIKIVLELYKGTYQEHLYLQECYNIILKEINKNN